MLWDLSKILWIGSRYFSHKIFSRFQNGDLNVEEFYSHLREILGNPNVSNERLKEAWNKMVEDIPAQNVAALKKLQLDFNIYLFSNTNPIHVEKIEREFYQTYGFLLHHYSGRFIIRMKYLIQNQRSVRI